MPQVIEVRFVNTRTQEVLFDGMTLANTHKESIDLAWKTFSHGEGEVKEIIKIEGGIFSGPTPCWRFAYLCVVADDEYDRECMAVLFASYPHEYPKERKDTVKA